MSDRQYAYKEPGGRLAKVLGSDTELGNVVISSLSPERHTGARAAWALLDAVDGIGSRRAFGDFVYRNPQDVGRKYLAQTGGCCYIDLEHFEVCTPETASARDFTAAWQAMLSISQDALAVANADMPEGERVDATVNNSDGGDSSWGGHISVLIHRELFNDLCVRPEFLPFGYLASFQISSMVFAGAGKVGVENGHDHVPYQISQRADFVESLMGPQTTCHRPLVNTRDEALCGPQVGAEADMARLHVIFYDTTLAPVATYLKAGALQLVLAMLEAGRVHSRYHVTNPLQALQTWSHDPDLNARATLLDGRRVSAVEHQMLILEDVKAFVASGEADAFVPEAANIVALWEEVLVQLEARDWSALAGRLDWVARRLLIDSAVRRNGIEWDSAEAKHLDLLFANLDPQLGMHWALARDGVIEQISTPEEVAYFMANPPENTRAWARTMLLRRAGREAIDRVNWDSVTVRLPGSLTGRQTVTLGSPLDHTREASEDIFSTNPDLPDLLAALDARESGWASRFSTWATDVVAPGWRSSH